MLAKITALEQGTDEAGGPNVMDVGATMTA